MSDMQYASLLSSANQPTANMVKPTIFDIMAQENMHSLFQQSFKHIFKWVINNTNNSSRLIKLNKLKKYTDEVYLLIHSVIEYGYLKVYDSLFSEYFYGMKRVSLNNRKRLLSILFSLCIPYLKSKLDDYYEKVEKFDLDSESSKMKKLIKKFYPIFHLFYSLVFFYYKFKFIINKSDFNSPLLSLLNLKLVYNTSNETESNKSFILLILKYLNYGFTSFIFLLQFLKWHEQYVDSRSYDINNDNTELSFINLYKLIFTNKKRGEDYDELIDGDSILIQSPELPSKITEKNYFKLLMKDKDLCPLCMVKRKNQCALSVSGFVFCYTCIFKFVKQHNRCPITNYPCSTKNIIRIYDHSKND